MNLRRTLPWGLQRPLLSSLATRASRTAIASRTDVLGRELLTSANSALMRFVISVSFATQSRKAISRSFRLGSGTCCCFSSFSSMAGDYMTKALRGGSEKQIPRRCAPRDDSRGRSGAGLHIQVLHVQGILLDELAPHLDVIAHQRGENLLGLGSVIQAHLQQRPRLGVHGRIP